MEANIFQVVIIVFGLLISIIGFFIVNKLNDMKEQKQAQDDRMTTQGVKMDKIDQRITRNEEKIAANFASDANYMGMLKEWLDARLQPITSDIDYIKKHLK